MSTFPNLYFNITLNLTSLGSDYSGGSHRLYWYADSFLGGSDSGFEFGGTTTGGQTVAGVYSADGSLIEAFRQVAGQNLTWVAGDYHCPYSGPQTAVACGAAVTNGFINDYVDFPSLAGTNTTPIDNGFGVNSALSSSHRLDDVRPAIRRLRRYVAAALCRRSTGNCGSARHGR